MARLDEQGLLRGTRSPTPAWRVPEWSAAGRSSEPASAQTLHAEEVTVHDQAGPRGPDLTSRAGSGAPGARDASSESASVERGGTSQRAHEAARTSHAEEVTVHGEAWPGGPDLTSRAGSGAPGARDASWESASLERGGTSQRAREAARTSHAEEVTLHGEAGPRGPDLENRAGSGATGAQRQLGGRRRGARRDVAASPRGRARRWPRRSQYKARRGPEGQT